MPQSLDKRPISNGKAAPSTFSTHDRNDPTKGGQFRNTYQAEIVSNFGKMCVKTNFPQQDLNDKSDRLRLNCLLLNFPINYREVYFLLHRLLWLCLLIISSWLAPVCQGGVLILFNKVIYPSIFDVICYFTSSVLIFRLYILQKLRDLDFKRCKKKDIRV